MKLFNKLSSYIMQEDMIQPRLTVKEALTYAACLKLSSHIEYSVKLAVVSARGNKSATTILF
jgi:ABC-type multidrug transport system ATPase subunit